MLKKLWDWIYRSSKNPSKVSLTVKGVIASVAIYAVFAIGIFGGHADVAGFTDVGKTIGDFIEQILLAISSLITAWGLLRKISITVRGWFVK